VRARLSGYQDDSEEEQQEQEEEEEDLVGRRQGGAAAAAGPGRPEQQQNQQQGQQQDKAAGGKAKASPGSRAVLLALLVGAGCREERAVMLPEAFMPPGLEVRRGGVWWGGGPVVGQGWSCTSKH
jgi:hypothetical protein